MSLFMVGWMEGFRSSAIAVPVLAEGPGKRRCLRSCSGRVRRAGRDGECGNHGAWSDTKDCLAEARSSVPPVRVELVN